MRQHKYCMHSIKKIGACRKRKKKKSLSAGDLRSPGPAATRNRCVHHLQEPRSRPPSASPARPARSGAGLAGRAQRREGAGAAPFGGPCGCPPLRCWMRVGGPAPRPVLSLGRAGRPGRSGGKVMHAGKALAPGTGNRGPGFRGRERRRAGPTVSSATERCGGEGMRGGGQGRCESLKLKQGPAAWGCSVCLRSRLLIGIMWGSGRGGDSCDRRDASRRSARPGVAPAAPHRSLGRRAGGREGGAGGRGAGEAPSLAPSLG